MSPSPACPACGVNLARHVALPWGNGQQRQPVAPWICASCGALAVIDLATGVLTPTTDDMWEVVRQRNPVLWGEIERLRAAIRPPQEDPP
jgi:hypothetical protein